MKTLCEDLCKPIQTDADAKRFVEALVKAELDWHFDDCAVDCLHETNPHVSREDAELLNAQRDRLYDFKWGSAKCPIGYVLQLRGWGQEETV